MSPLSGYWVGPEVQIMTHGRPETPQLRPFFTDGCSSSPDRWPWQSQKESWYHCCVQHDIDYWMGGSRQERSESDERLKTCIYKSGSPYAALFFRTGVNIFGSAHSPLTFRWGYGWNERRLYKTLSQTERNQIFLIYKKSPEQLKVFLQKHPSLNTLETCTKPDLIFYGFNTTDQKLFNYINLRLKQLDEIEWIKLTVPNLETEHYALKLKSCSNVILLSVTTSGHIQLENSPSCFNWKVDAM